MTIKQNLHQVQKNILEFEKKYNRLPNSVQLLAASKKQPISYIKQAYDAGQRLFGENYVQEALPKIVALRGFNIEWHFIGPIQSNKTKKIAMHFDWVHSVDNCHIAERLSKQRSSSLPPLNICIEVNMSHEATKAGISPEELLVLAQHCQRLPNIVLRGLMTIPAIEKNLHEQRKVFQKIHTLFDILKKKGLSLDTLSMGMSGDYEAAVAEGATIVRIGTAIFGERI